MKIFYKYYYVFFITILVMAIILGVCRAGSEVKVDRNDNKVIVKADNNIKDDAESVDTKSLKPTINKSENQQGTNNKKNVTKDSINEQKNIKSEDNKDTVNIEDEETVNVFKVNKNEIVNQYTSFEKLELLSILKIKLDEKNYKTIESLIYSEEKDIDKLKKINSILKENLTKKDYDKILTLAGRVINIDLVSGK